MINEELENYTEDGSSTLNNGESYGSDLGYEDDEDFVRYRKDMIFQNIDFTKHKTKIGCTIGYVFSPLLSKSRPARPPCFLQLLPHRFLSASCR